MPEFSRILHQANYETELRDLVPGTTYTVDLIFPFNVSSTKVTNTHPITFTTLREEGKEFLIIKPYLKKFQKMK